MNLKTYKTNKLIGVILFLAVATLLILTVVVTHQDHITSIGWHDLASVGWVTTPG